jgi:Cu2+-exporting ATPase
VPASEAQAKCLHCGTDIVDRWAPPGFCCAGCAQVHAIILSCGLERYYELRSETIAPVNESVLGTDDFTWLAAAQAAAEAKGRRELRVAVRGVSCVGCVWLIEKTLGETHGILAARVNAHQGLLHLEWREGADLSAQARGLCRFGYLMVPDDGKAAASDDGLLLRLGLCGAFAMNAMLATLPGYLGLRSDESLAGLLRLLSVGCATLSMLVGASFFISRALAALRHGRLHMDLPIGLGLAAAYAASFVGWFAGRPDLEYWDFVSLFTFLMLVGRWTQERAIESNRRRLPPSAPAVREVPVYASAEATTALRQADPRTLQPGEVYGLAPGQVAPVGGRLLGAEAELSLAWINGESEPVSYPTGRLVPSGALNVGRREIRLKSNESWDNSLLRRLSEAGDAAVGQPPGLERILGIYLATVMVLAALGFGLRVALTSDWPGALQSAISVLVVSCPCAIGLAFPLATELSVGALRRSGVYVREHRVWEQALRIRQVVFDKTGTLTLEYPRLANPQDLGGLTCPQRAALLALVEGNLHPFGRSLREALARGQHIEPTEGALSSLPGLGQTLTDASGAVWSLGKPGWKGTAEIAEGAVTEFSLNGNRLALFRFAEEPRPHAAEEIAGLRRRGLAIFILSGDQPAKVTGLLTHLGLPASAGLGGLTPEQKAAWVREHDGAHTLMLGDGANDALAFGEATLRGTPVVDLSLLEQKADFYLLGRDLKGLGRLLDLARLRRRVLTEVFVFAVVYNGLTVGLALAGKMSPLLATLMMPTSAILTLVHVTARLRKA